MTNPKCVLRGGRFLALAFSPDGKFIAGGQHDGTVRIWKTDTGTDWHMIPGRKVADFDFSARIKAIAFAADGKSVAWAGANGIVTVLDLGTKQVKQRLGPHEPEILALTFLEPAVLVSAASRGPVRAWHSVSGESRVLFAIKQMPDAPPRGLFIGSMVMDIERKRLLIAIDHEMVVLDVSNPASAKELSRWRGGDYCAFSRCGTKAAAAQARKLTLRDARTGVELGTMSCSGPGFVRSMAFSPDGTMLAVALNEGERLPSHLSIWSIPRKRELVRFVCHKGIVTAVGWSPDGQTVAVATDDIGEDTIRLWDVSSILGAAKD